MAKNTGISWADHSWNPFRAKDKETGKKGWFCVPKSSGCSFCYAGLMNKRFGTGHDYKKSNVKHIDFYIDESKLNEPKKWKPSVVFINSMTDMFLEHYTDEQRIQVLHAMAATPKHIYLSLTKHPDRMIEFMKKNGESWPECAWIGVSVESKKHLDRIDILRQSADYVGLKRNNITTEPIFKPKLFISFEPLLQDLGKINLNGISWAIVGGESGVHLLDESICQKRGLAEYEQYPIPKWIPREDRIDWVTSIKEQADKAGVCFFFKQWGGTKPNSAGALLNGETHFNIPMLPAGRNANGKELNADQPDSQIDLFSS